MVSDTCPLCRPAHPDIRGAMVSYLHGRAAVTAADLARRFRVSVDVVRTELDSLVYAGAVEVLRPVSSGVGPSPHHSVDFDLEYYRWRQATDRDYLWQTELRSPRPVWTGLPHPAGEFAALMNY